MSEFANDIGEDSTLDFDPSVDTTQDEGQEPG